MAPCCPAVLLTLCFVLLTSVGTKADAIDNDVCTYFSLLDINGNLQLEADDFAILFLRFQTSGCISLKGQLLILEKFAELFPLTDRSLAEYLKTGPVSLNQFILNMRDRRGGADLEGDIAYLIYFLHTVFQCEGNDTLTLTYREFSAIYKAFGILQAVNASFTALDVNNDKKISYNECYSGALKYFNGVNDGRSILWGGPLKTCLEVAKNDQSSLPPGA